MSWITPIADIVGSVVGGIQSRNAAQNAGQAELNYAQQAQQLEQKYQQQGLDFQQNEWTGQQANEQPFLNTGQEASLNLSSLLNTPGSGLLSAYPGGQFTAPTLAQAEAMPGFQFQEQQGEQAVQNSAAASGELLDPNAARAEANYAENLAQTDYGNLYNQALQTYGTNYGTWEQNQQDIYNRLYGASGIGTMAAGQLGQEGNAAALNMSQLLLGGGQQQAQQLNNQGSAIAASDIGSANAWNAMISGILGSMPGNSGGSPYMGGGSYGGGGGMGGGMGGIMGMFGGGGSSFGSG